MLLPGWLSPVPELPKAAREGRAGDQPSLSVPLGCIPHPCFSVTLELSFSLGAIVGPWKFAISSKFDAARGGWGAGIPPQAAPLPPQSVGHFLAFFAVGPAPDPPPARGHSRGLGGGPGLELGLLTGKAGVQRNWQRLTSTLSDVCALSGPLVAEPAPRFIPRERHTMRGELEVWQCTVPEIRWDLESSWGRGWGRVEGSFLYCTQEVLGSAAAPAPFL